MLSNGIQKQPLDMPVPVRHIWPKGTDNSDGCDQAARTGSWTAGNMGVNGESLVHVIRHWTIYDKLDIQIGLLLFCCSLNFVP